MSKIKYIAVLIIILALIFTAKTVLQADDCFKTSLDKVIEQNDLSKTAVVSVSIRDVQSGKPVYERDSNLLLHSASTLKAFITPVILKYLGAEGNISTSLYKNGDKFYLKLSGDPLLTRQDLFKLFKKVKKINSLYSNENGFQIEDNLNFTNQMKSLKTESEINSQPVIIIDDTAIDDIPWGIGWMWDDGTNPNMPKYNAYNLDGNLIKIKLEPGGNVTVTPDYPVKIIKESPEKDFAVERRFWLNKETIYITGKTLKPVEMFIPVSNPENYFIHNLNQALKNISSNAQEQKGKVPPQAVLVEEISHPIQEEVAHMSQKSINLAAETLFKLAAEKYSGKTGTTRDAIKAFDEFYNELGADTSELLIVDGSGASHNNLIQTDWMSLALSKLYNQPNFDIYRKTLAAPKIESTLKNRLPEMHGNLWAKTGTSAGISGLTGYFKSASGKTYSFAILIQNYKGSSAPAKALEDEIIMLIRNL